MSYFKTERYKPVRGSGFLAGVIVATTDQRVAVSNAAKNLVAVSLSAPPAMATQLLNQVSALLTVVDSYQPWEAPGFFSWGSFDDSQSVRLNLTIARQNMLTRSGQSDRQWTPQGPTGPMNVNREFGKNVKSDIIDPAVDKLVKGVNLGFDIGKYLVPLVVLGFGGLWLANKAGGLPRFSRAPAPAANRGHKSRALVTRFSFNQGRYKPKRRNRRSRSARS
jgi:hypothetical protein